MQVKIISWNIWKSKYLDNVILFLKKADPDIICLQEVVEIITGNITTNAAQKVADALGFKYVYAKAITSKRGEAEYDLGNAIVSKYPITASSTHFLSDMDTYENNAETEPRNVIVAEIALGDIRVHIATTHLAYSDYLHPSLVRARQIQELVKHLPRANTVLTGDFNNIVTDDELKPLWHFLKSADPQPIQPTWSVYPTLRRDWEVKGLEYRIDNIFTTKDLRVLDFQIGKTKASDHLPLITTIEI